MLVKAGQIIAIDSVKVDPTLSGDGVNSPLGVKAVAPTVSGHAGLSAEKNGNDVFLGLNNNAFNLKSLDGSVEIHGGVQPDGTFEYNIQVSAEPVVSDTKIYGGEGIKVDPEGSATYRVSVSGDYLKSGALNGYATQTWVNDKGYATESWTTENFQPKGEYVVSADLDYYYKKTDIDAYSAKVNSEFTKTSAWAKSEFQSKSEMSAYYKKSDVYTKEEVNDLIDDYALSADVDTAIAENEESIKTWANDKFQEIGDYAEKSDIDSLSSTVNANFQKKGEYVTSADSSLEGKALILKNNKWEEAPAGTTYTEGPNIDIDGTVISGRDWSPELNAVKDDIDDLNAAVAKEFVSTSAWVSGAFQPVGDYLTDEDLENYYTKSEVNGKVESAIDEISATIDRDFALKTELEGKLDKSETTNWDIKEYSGSDYITILNHKISGKDWTTEIDAKQDKLTDNQLSAISSVSAIEAMSGKWVTSGDVIAGDYYYGLVNNNGTVEWAPIPAPDYPYIVGNNGISAEFDDDNNEWNIGLSGKPVYMFDKYKSVGTVTAGTVIEFTGQDYEQITVTNGYFELPATAEKVTFNINENVENNNTGLHEYLLNKFALVTNSNDVLVYTQNYYPAEVGSSNGTIAITVDHSVAPTRKYAVVYSGSDVAASANLNFTMSIYSNRI